MLVEQLLLLSVIQPLAGSSWTHGAFNSIHFFTRILLHICSKDIKRSLMTRYLCKINEPSIYFMVNPRWNCLKSENQLKSSTAQWDWLTVRPKGGRVKWMFKGLKEAEKVWFNREDEYLNGSRGDQKLRELEKPPTARPTSALQHHQSSFAYRQPPINFPKISPLS